MNKVEKAAQEYFAEIAKIYQSGRATDEESYYPPLKNFLSEVCASMPVPANCLFQPMGASHPDFVLYGEEQAKGDLPKHGVVEAKGLTADISSIFESEHASQMQKYLREFNILTVTNYWEFYLFRKESDGSPELLEKYSIADSKEQFLKIAKQPRKLARKHEVHLQEFVKRALAYSSSISKPKDVAELLASYARDALVNIENVVDNDSDLLAPLKQTLDESLGNPFKTRDQSQGDRLFCSTLSQTLFYGMFSAWVSYAKDPKSDRFDWQSAQHSISIPALKSLYARLTIIKKLDLNSVLDHAAEALNRIDREAFLEEFEKGNAIQHFYQPFLKAFDPDSQVKMGVYYTPPEIVKFQVERVDRALREELGIKDGLADEQVHVLDPCCGTGAYLLEVLHKIKETLNAKKNGKEPFLAQKLKTAAMTRIKGFEIMPAPFLIAHWRIKEFIKDTGNVSMSEDDRMKIILTNSLIGWDGEVQDKKAWLDEFQNEQALASTVKRKEPILVVIGNPPYNAYAGVAPEEEGDLTKPYKDKLREYTQVRRANLDDLYIRFLRVAEMRIEKEKRGIISYITSDSWLSKISFTGMRAHFLENFNKVWIEKMPGSVFKIKGFSEGIKQGVATTLLVKTTGGGGGPLLSRFNSQGFSRKAESRSF